MAWTDRYVSADASGGDGLLITTPWTLAEAIANEAAGMRINVKAGTYANTTTSRTFAAVGTATAPILWEGYNTTPGDICGRAGLPANNALTKPLFSWTTGQAVVSGAYHRIAGINFDSAYVAAASGTMSVSGTPFAMTRCRLTNTAAHANARAFTSSVASFITLCYFSSTATAATVVGLSNGSHELLGCTARGGIISFTTAGNPVLFDSCVADSPTTTGFSVAGAQPHITRCVAYNCTNGVLATSATVSQYVTNCIFSTCTNGFNQNSGGNSSFARVTGCAFYGVTNPIVGVQECATAADDLFVQQGNVTLTADPFVNAAGHDFSLNPASAARGAGIPGAFENETYVAYTDAGAVGNSRIWKRASERVAR